MLTQRIKERELFVYFLFASLLYLFFIQGYPLIWSIYVSMTSQRIGVAGKFIGFRNYFGLFSQSFFWRAMGFT